MAKQKPALPKVYEPDEDLVHYAPPLGLDQVTMCGKTDWIGDATGWETFDDVNCFSCQQLANHFKTHRIA